jgi:deoxyribose-phosphate aldolase
MTIFDRYAFTEKELKFRAGEITGRRTAEEEKKEMMNVILGMIDLTTLEGSDTDIKIFSMCEFARTLPNLHKNLNKVAAVCFYPLFIRNARKHLEGSGIKVAAVAGGFPSGQLPLNLKLNEIAFAVDEGADEIDVVINRGHVLMDKTQLLMDELTAMREACASRKMKVILETGELEQVDKIRTACEIAINAGADFLKTSTGKINPGATHEAFLIMLDTIKEYFVKTGRMIGIKPAGGIAEPEDAMAFYKLVKEILGDDWLTSDYFRIGASRLATKLADQIKD